MNYVERDSFGMYAAATVLDDTVPNRNRGPGPYLMGADTLLGNDVVNARDEDLGDIKEIMLDMRTGLVSYAVLSFGGVLGHQQQALRARCEHGPPRKCTRFRQRRLARHGRHRLGKRRS